MPNPKLTTAALACTLAVWASLGLPPAAFAQAQTPTPTPAPAPTVKPDRPRIEKAADLPRFTYPLKGSLENLVRNDAAFAAFAVQLRSDLESVLGKYEIADKSMQRQMLGTLLQIDMLENKDAAALERIAAIRALEEKPADKLLSGMQPQAVIEARQAAGTATAATSEAYRREVGQRIAKALQHCPTSWWRMK